MILVLTTIHKKDAAVKIGQGLLKQRLIVCYNLFPVDGYEVPEVVALRADRVNKSYLDWLISETK